MVVILILTLSPPPPLFVHVVITYISQRHMPTFSALPSDGTMSHNALASGRVYPLGAPLGGRSVTLADSGWARAVDCPPIGRKQSERPATRRGRPFKRPSASAAEKHSSRNVRPRRAPLYNGILRVPSGSSAAGLWDPKERLIRDLQRPVGGALRDSYQRVERTQIAQSPYPYAVFRSQPETVSRRHDGLGLRHDGHRLSTSVERPRTKLPVHADQLTARDLLDWRSEVLTHGSDVETLAMNITQAVILTLPDDEVQALSDALGGTNLFWDVSQTSEITNSKDMNTNFTRAKERAEGEACAVLHQIPHELRDPILNCRGYAGPPHCPDTSYRNMLAHTSKLVEDGMLHFKREYSKVRSLEQQAAFNSPGIEYDQNGQDVQMDTPQMENQPHMGEEQPAG